MRYLQVLAIWVLAAVVALWIAATTRIGPTVFVLSTRHGIHLGDLIAVGACVSWAADVTARLLRRRTST